MAIDREIELKFAIDEAGIAALHAHSMVQNTSSMVRGERSEYFDTVGLHLYEARLTLRLRHAHGQAVQTVERFRTSQMAFFDRGECECIVTNGTLDFAAIAGAPLGALLSDRAVRDALGVRFINIVDRTARRVDFQDAAVEIALDTGDVIAGCLKLPIRELECERKDGARSSMFAVAAAPADRAPRRPILTSKGDRGVALAKIASPTPSKAISIELDRKLDVSKAARLIVANCVDHLYRNTALLSKAGDPAALHQAHIATRRLRTAMRLFRRCLDEDVESEWDQAAVSLRDLARMLGEARDLDVAMSRFGNDPGIRARLALWRDAAYSRTAAYLRDSAFCRCLIQILAAVQTMAITADKGSAPIGDFAAARLARLRQRLLKAGQDMSKLSPDALHRVRVLAKQMHYSCQFFESLFAGKRRRRYRSMTKALGRLQIALGTLNDQTNAARILGDEYQPTCEIVKLQLEASETAFATIRQIRPFWH